MTSPRPRTGFAVMGAFAAVVSLSAYAGACGLIFGSIDLGEEVTSRLPFNSTVFAGIALALVVGIPTTVASWMAFRHHPWTDQAFFVAGSLIIGWIVVQMSVIRTVNYLHLVYLLTGVIMLSWIRRAIPRWSHRPPEHHDSSPGPTAPLDPAASRKPTNLSGK